MDTGASSQLSDAANQLTTSTPYKGFDQVTMGNDHLVPIQNVSQGILRLPTHKIILFYIFYASKLSHNLLYVNKLMYDNNCSITFDANGNSLKEKMTHKILLHGPNSNGLYLIQSSPNPPPTLHGLVGRTTTITTSI